MPTRVTRIFQVANTSRAAILTDDPARASVKDEKEMREMNYLIPLLIYPLASFD